MSKNPPSPTEPFDWIWVFVFIPLWFGVLTFCTDGVLGFGWRGIPAAIFCSAATFLGGDVYEWLRDRKIPKRFKEDAEVWWVVRMVVYLAVVPLLPMVVIYALRALGSPGMEWINENGAWSGAESLAILFAFFRMNENMPLSFSRLLKDPRRIR